MTLRIGTPCVNCTSSIAEFNVVPVVIVDDNDGTDNNASSKNNQSDQGTYDTKTEKPPQTSEKTGQVQDNSGNPGNAALGITGSLLVSLLTTLVAIIL